MYDTLLVGGNKEYLLTYAVSMKIKKGHFRNYILSCGTNLLLKTHRTYWSLNCKVSEEVSQLSQHIDKRMNKMMVSKHNEVNAVMVRAI